jgi:hypothetical protein
MPKRWKVVSVGGTSRLGAAGGEKGGGGQSGKAKIEIYLEDGDSTTLPWEWDSKHEARQAIEGALGWKKAKVEE